MHNLSSQSHGLQMFKKCVSLPGTKLLWEHKKGGSQQGSQSTWAHWRLSGWPECEPTPCLHEHAGRPSLGLEALGWPGPPVCSPVVLSTPFQDPAQQTHPTCSEPLLQLLSDTEEVPLSFPPLRSPRKHSAAFKPPRSDLQENTGRTDNGAPSQEGPTHPLPWGVC